MGRHHKIIFFYIKTDGIFRQFLYIRLTKKHIKTMVLKIINSLLILIAVFMGLKQGYAMLSGKPEMVEMFSKWNFNKTGLSINGILTILASLLILFPKTFVWGNFLMAAGILLIICFHLLDKDLKGVIIELPFLLLNMIIIYLQYPLKNIV
jgi:hypothetical protein